MIEAIKAVEKVKSIQEVLDEPIPRDVISKRKGGSGKSLDYLEGWYVVDRMNQLFGPFGWHCETVFFNQVTGPGTPHNTNGHPDTPVSYIAKVRIVVNGNPGNIVHEGTGYGSDKGGFNPHELAIKEAETDAFKRAAMKFGRSMGLALYDKTQEYVTETKIESTSGTGTSGGIDSKAPGASEATKVNTYSTTPVGIDTKQAPVTAEEYASACKDRNELNDKLTATARACVAKKKWKEMLEIKAEMSTKYGTDDKAKLTDTQAKEFLMYLYNTLYGVK